MKWVNHSIHVEKISIKIYLKYVRPLFNNVHERVNPVMLGGNKR